MVDKTVIIGVPKSGKTTYALAHHEKDQIVHTDELLDVEGLKWEDRSQVIVDLMIARKVFCVEGCDAVRGLRKFMVQNPKTRPCDHVVWMGRSREELSKGQTSFGKGCKRIFDDILGELHGLGIMVTIM